MDIQNENEQNLDNKVQELLNDLTVPYNPDHWQIMAQRLEALDAADSSFDSRVRQQLENTVPSFQATHWDLMNKKLNDLSDADAEFDATIREQLDKIHRTYQPKHWELMSQRIEQEFSWKAKIMRYKVVEVALMLLLLFTVFNYFETIGYETESEFKTSEPKSIEKKAEPKSFNRGTDWRIRDNKIETKQQDKNSKPENNQPPIVLIEANGQRTMNNGKSENAITEINVQNVENQGIALKENSQIGISNEFFNKQSLISQKSNINALVEIPILKASELALAQKDLILSENTEGGVSTQSIAVLRPNALTIAQFYDDLILPQTAKKDRWWRLGLFSSGSLSNVSSSYVYNETKKWNFWTLNKGIGLVTGYRKKKLELETGFSYNSIRYQPDLPAAILEGRIITGLPITHKLTKEVDLGILRLPLNLNIHFQDKNRWHIYAVAGVSLNGAIKIDTVNFAPIAPTLLNAYSRSSKDRDFPVYGEPFKVSPEKNINNFYFTANLGMGVEYKITPRYSAYVQPQYERQFNKAAIGSRGDRINSMTVQGGVKMRFGNLKY